MVITVRFYLQDIPAVYEKVLKPADEVQVGMIERLSQQGHAEVVKVDLDRTDEMPPDFPSLSDRVRLANSKKNDAKPFFVGPSGA